MPKEVAIVVDRINGEIAARKERGAHFEVEPYELDWLYVCKPVMNMEGYLWGIASNFEDGGESTLWDGTRWIYRDPWDGADRAVPYGRDEVIENWVCFYTA